MYISIYTRIYIYTYWSVWGGIHINEFVNEFGRGKDGKS